MLLSIFEDSQVQMSCTVCTSFSIDPPEASSNGVRSKNTFEMPRWAVVKHNSAMTHLEHLWQMGGSQTTNSQTVCDLLQIYPSQACLRSTSGASDCIVLQLHVAWLQLALEHAHPQYL